MRFRAAEDLSHVDEEYLLRILRRQYLPLLLSDFLDAYKTIEMYSVSPTFIINGSARIPSALTELMLLKEVKRLHLRAGRGSIGWGAIGVADQDRPIGGDSYGILLCTHGKVIKPSLFGLSTGLLGSKLFGIVEVPDLIHYLTTSKTDLKGGPGRIRGLNRLLDPVREELKIYLATHGIQETDQRRDHVTARVERELTRMIDSLPELRDFDGLRRRQGSNSNTSSKDARKVRSAREGIKKKRRSSNPRSGGPRIAFEEHPEREETAWLDSNTVVINSGHAAYSRRINQDQARVTYCMFAIGVALAKAELIESHDGSSYVDKFISAWGNQ